MPTSLSMSPHASIRLVRALLCGTLLLVTILALIPHPPHLPFVSSDKTEHMLAFAGLGVLGVAAAPRLSGWRILAVLAGYGGLIEVLQAIPVLNRDSDIMDWFADMVAAAAAVAIARSILLWRISRSRRPQKS